MLFTTGSTALINRAKTAVAYINRKAVALAEPSAAIVAIQRLAPSFPPTQNANSAPCSLTSARQFSGSIAQTATNALIIATYSIF